MDARAERERGREQQESEDASRVSSSRIRSAVRGRAWPAAMTSEPSIPEKGDAAAAGRAEVKALAAHSARRGARLVRVACSRCEQAGKQASSPEIPAETRVSAVLVSTRPRPPARSGAGVLLDPLATTPLHPLVSCSASLDSLLLSCSRSKAVSQLPLTPALCAPSPPRHVSFTHPALAPLRAPPVQPNTDTSK